MTEPLKLVPRVAQDAEWTRGILRKFLELDDEQLDGAVFILPNYKNEDGNVTTRFFTSWTSVADLVYTLEDVKYSIMLGECTVTGDPLLDEDEEDDV